MPVKVIERGIFLTFDEIRILLFNMGVTEIEGVYMPEKIFTEKEILLAMHHLSEEDFIEAREEKFLIREDIRNLLEVMAAPLCTDIWSPLGKEGPKFFLYIKGDQVVVSERFFRKKDTLKLSLFEKEAFEKWREEIMDDHRRN